MNEPVASRPSPLGAASGPVATGRVAVLAGASGLVGRELSQLLCASPSYAQLHALLRRSGAGVACPKLRELVVDFEQLPPLPHCDDVFVALGTTIKQAGSEQAFRRVDFDYVVAAARAGLLAGATRLGVVSALGADASSRMLYNRVKGEMERAIAALGYESIVIAQPSLLLGDRRGLGQPARSGEAWAQRLLGPVSGLLPARVRPVSARAVAQALLAALLNAAPGVRVLSSRELSQG